MSIKYYPNRNLSPLQHSAEAGMKKSQLLEFNGVANIASNALSVTLSSEKEWKINSIGLNFSSATARDYSWVIVNGVKIIEKANDFLWFQLNNPTTLWTKITLDEGFYTGTELAAHLESKLDTAFASASVTFTVAYADGKFSIIPSGSTEIKYIQEAPQPLTTRQSIAGHLFGFTTDSAFSTPLESDTTVAGLDNLHEIVDETGSISTFHYNNDGFRLSPDEAFRIATGTAPIEVSYRVHYEKV